MCQRRRGRRRAPGCRPETFSTLSELSSHALARKARREPRRARVTVLHHSWTNTSGRDGQVSRAAWRTRHRSITALAGTALLLSAGSIAVATTDASSADSPRVSARAAWTVYHGNALGSGVDPSGVTFSPANPA